MNANFKVLELAAGGGGLALGLDLAGFCTKDLIEIDNWCVETLKRNKPGWNVIKEDLNKVADDIRSYISEQNVDVLSGGFPCQSFSYAGKRGGFEDERGKLFFSFLKILKELKPKAFVFENVKGLLSNNEGKTFKHILESLEETGYKIFYKVLNANNYGVAQKRERVFIVGIRKDHCFKDFSFPQEFIHKKVLKDVLKNVPKSKGYSYAQEKIEVLKLVPPGGCWRDLPEDIAKKYMKKSYYLGGGKTGMARRISWNEPSLTLTTSPMQKQTERCHPEETRPFTVREYARIQSFPDDWIFMGNLASQYKQIGNAVPVKLAQIVGKTLMEYLLEGQRNGIQY